VEGWSLQTATASTAMAVHTDAAILGKLGEFGQAVVRRKASQMMAQFARNVSTELRAL
jgi:carbon monoxide dehydrogenase subunit G